MPDKKTFLSFGFRLFLYVLAGVVLSDILFYYTTNHSLGRTYYDTLVVMEVAKHTSMLLMFSVNAFIYLAALLLVFTASIVMSHRISGPMYRFMKTSIAVAEGDLTIKTILREGDLLKMQAEKLSGSVSSMRERLTKCVLNVEELKNKSYALEGAIGSGNCADDKARETVGEMKASARELVDTLSYFKTR